MTIRRILCVLWCLPLLNPVRGQEADAVFRSTSRLVQVNVIAHDKNGKPVSDLDRGDFVLTDNGHPQTISVFRMETAEGYTPNTMVGANTNPLTVGNRAGQSARTSLPVTVILFDGLNIDTMEHFLYGKRELLKVLRTLQVGDPVALYSLNGPSIRVIHDFTDSSDSLVEAARRISGVQLLRNAGPAPPLATTSSQGRADGVFAQLAAFAEEASKEDEAARLRLVSEWTMSGLEDVARHLSGIPGRKNLIWISGGFPISIDLSPARFKATGEIRANDSLFLNSEREKRIGRMLTEAQVAIYPVDPAGLFTEQLYSASTPSTGAAIQIKKQAAAGHMITEGEMAAPRFTTLQLIAKQTGGLAFYNANDVAGSIRRAMDDARVTYTLGFYPSEDAWDGKYHQLRVNVNRPGVQIRARNGYLAKTDAESGPDRQEALRLAVASPLEGVAIGLKVNVESNPLDWKIQDVVAVISPQDVRFEEREGRMRAEVDAVFAQQAPDGRIVQGEKKVLAYNLTPESYQTALTQGLFLKERLAIAPAAYRLRIVMRDVSTGALGSVSVPVRRETKSSRH